MMFGCRARPSGAAAFYTFLQFCALLSLTVNAEDYYKILGIKRSATVKEIKKAYRAKSLQHHPDKGGDAEVFAKIARAYEVLSEEDKKEIYDNYGEDGLKQHEQGGGGGPGGGDPFEDIFSQFGFNFGGGGRRRRDEERSTPDVDLPLYLTMEQLYKGETLEVEYVREVLCLNWKECMKPMQECQGPGVRVKMQQLAPGFVQQVQQRDERCIARGKMWRPGCKECPQGQTQTEKIDLTIDVTKGMRNGERITFEGVADEKPGYSAGDLNFVIVEKEDDRFHRDGDNLYANLEIPLVDSLTGFEMQLEHLDGHAFKVNVDGVTECDYVMRVPGKGMPRRSGRGFGDLYLTFEVDFPESLTQEQKDAIKKILGKGGADSAASGGDEL